MRRRHDGLAPGFRFADRRVEPHLHAKRLEDLVERTGALGVLQPGPGGDQERTALANEIPDPFEGFLGPRLVGMEKHQHVGSGEFRFLQLAGTHEPPPQTFDKRRKHAEPAGRIGAVAAVLGYVPVDKPLVEDEDRLASQVGTAWGKHGHKRQNQRQARRNPGQPVICGGGWRVHCGPRPAPFRPRTAFARRFRSGWVFRRGALPLASPLRPAQHRSGHGKLPDHGQDREIPGQKAPQAVAPEPGGRHVQIGRWPCRRFGQRRRQFLGKREAEQVQHLARKDR